MELPIDSIVVRERSRVELRNISSLADSIRETGGPLHPPVVRRDGSSFVLVAGARRLAACRLLGYDRVTVTVAHSLVDELSALKAEGEENTEREPFTPSEAVAHAARIEGVLAAQAKERQRVAGETAGRGIARAESAPPIAEPKTRTQVARAVGMGATKLTEAKAVIATANDESLPDPVRQVAKDAIVEMDRTGNVHRAAVKVAKAVDEHSPLNQFLNGGDERLTKWQHNFSKAIVAGNQPMEFTVEAVAAKADEELIQSLERLADRMSRFAANCRAAWNTEHPAGLRLVKEA